jgi:CRISPR system Cascade subunit CasE
LWRLEPERDSKDAARVLVQSSSLPDWSRINVDAWFMESPDHPIDLEERLKLQSLSIGQRFRFRLRANPSVTKNGKRLGLLRPIDQEAWIERKGREQCGFALSRLSSFGYDETDSKRIDVQVSQQQMLYCQKRGENGNRISIYSVLYDGFLTVVDPYAFRKSINEGIGHGKAMGLGLLSVVPVT